MKLTSPIHSAPAIFKGILAIKIILLLGLGTLSSFAQTDRDKILTLRVASNQSLKETGHDRFLSYMTDDVQVTTGNGTLIQEKETLRAYLAKAVGSQIYFVRTSLEVEVNPERGLAWESGTWKGYDTEKSATPMRGGRYAAQWTKANGEWRIRSELFVTLN